MCTHRGLCVRSSKRMCLFAHTGSIPGSKFKRPFICPMDHIFEIENGWFPERPYGNSEEQMGPRVRAWVYE